MRIKIHNSLAKSCRKTFLFQNKVAIVKHDNRLLLTYTIHDEQFFLSFGNNFFKKESGFGLLNIGEKFYWWESETYRWKDLQS